MLTLFQSIEFARIAHGEQQYGKLPYYYHLAEVLSFIGEYTADTNFYQAAVFHDILEDTYVTVETLGSIGVPLDVIHATILVTDPDGANRKERKEKLYSQFLTWPESYARNMAATVKLVDRFVNQRNCILDRRVKKIQMYHDEFSRFMEVFCLPTVSNKLKNALYEQFEAMSIILKEENGKV